MGLDSHAGSCAKKGLAALGLMLRRHYLESLNNFLTMASHFCFSLGSADFCSWSSSQLTLSASL